MVREKEVIYKLIISKCQTDGAEGEIVYGFKVGDDTVIYPDISPNRAKVEKLVLILNKEKVSLSQLQYIVEDYIS